ncbi:TRAP transporter small permease [Jiella avicenniae]|uniref:TRAP transporter small permease protein n=1 Tax=Jiella avicenniae TaxID=2907202 RepID=A0A9X1P1D4_9HYPH|nr:TRAP transporter small permease subunit [Jiella avicenniae]MCE7029602.1 TRAP transporter small permease subunit [Jiella avicenniae]
MPRFLKTVTRGFVVVLAFASGLSMALVFAIILANSLMRYTTGASLQWGEKLPIYLTIYGVMFGTALAYLLDRHVRFTIIIDTVNARLRHVFLLVVDVVMVVSGGLLAYAGWQFAERGGNLSASSIRTTARTLAETTGVDGLEIFGKLYPYQLAMAVGGVLVALAAFLKLVERAATDPDAEPATTAEMSETQL